jgi:hypothetical protein
MQTEAGSSGVLLAIPDLSAVCAVSLFFWKYIYRFSSAVNYMKKGFNMLVMKRSEFTFSAKQIEPMYIYRTQHSYFHAL